MDQVTVDAAVVDTRLAVWEFDDAMA